MCWKKASFCFPKYLKKRLAGGEGESLIEPQEPGHDVQGDEADRMSVAESEITLSLEDHCYYYDNDSPQMEEDAMRWLRQHKSEVIIRCMGSLHVP